MALLIVGVLIEVFIIIATSAAISIPLTAMGVIPVF